MSKASSIWYGAFIPSRPSPFVFGLAMLCYQRLIAELMSDVVIALGWWPKVTDTATHHVRPASPGLENVGLIDFFLWPIVESLLLIGAILLLQRWKCRYVAQLIAAASLLSLLHAIQYPVWAVLVFPLFLIDGATFVYWQNKSRSIAVLMVALLHLSSNAIPTLHRLARISPH